MLKIGIKVTIELQFPCLEGVDVSTGDEEALTGVERGHGGNRSWE